MGIGDSEQKIKQAFGDNYHFKETEGKDCLTYEDEGIQFEIHKYNRTVMEISVFRKTRQRPAGRRWVAPRKPKGLESGLVAYWKFDEGSGTMTYDSAGKSHGIVQGALWTTGKIDTGLGFDGVDDAVTTAVNVDQSPSSKGVTLCAWVYPTSISAGRHQVISSDNRGYDWSLLRQADKWYVFTGENSRSTGFSVDLFTWQHVTAVFVPGAGVRFYKNGDEFSIPHIACDESDNNIALGDNPGPWEEFFAGVIDEVRIYNEALSAEQVKQICGMTARWAKAPADRAPRYAARRAVPVATEMREGLMAHWKFDEGSGTTVYDSVRNNHGTIYGAKWTADRGLRFDGEDDYVDLGYAASLKASLPVTLSGWIKRSSSKSATFFALDEQRTTYYGIWLNVDRNQVLEIAFGDGQGGDSPGHRRSKHGDTVLNPHVWYHVAAVIRGPTDMDLYINGQDDGGYYSGSGGSLVYSSGISRIGAGNVYFDGEIGEVMIFDGALSAEEIRRIYKRQRKAKPITRDTGPKLTEGISGKAYYFDGEGDFINIFESESLDISGDRITVSAWIKAKRIDKRQVIVSKTGWGDNTWLVEINPIDCGRGKLNFYLNAGGRESNFCSRRAINTDAWYHVVFVYDGDERIIYINGQFDGRESYSGNINTNDQPIRIGSWGDPIGPGETRYFNGAIDEVAIYKRALSSDEIQQLYENVGRLSGSGLVGHWSFDADDGDVVIDSSLYHNDGKLEDRPEDYYRRHGWATRPTAGIVAPSSDKGPELTEGIRGKAYYFDGAGDYINIGESESLDISGKEITVSTWIKAKRIDERQVIAAKNALGINSWILEINPVDFKEGTVNFYLDLYGIDGNFGSNTAITVDTWYHVVGVYNGTERRIYVNGQFDASQVISREIPVNDQPVRIGGWGTPDRYFNGTIDEVALFNRALSASEIQQLYENPRRLTGNEPGLVGYWNFDADDGDTVMDSGPYHNHGKLKNEKPGRNSGARLEICG
ncbi:MAG: LamG domain-containing protein [Planctomycetota bacterium]